MFKGLSAFLKNFLAVFLLLFFIACSSKKNEIPADIIPREKMIAVLIDVQQAEAKIQALNLNANDSTRKIEYGYYKYIFNKHHISGVDFEKSFAFYSKNMELLNKIYEDVITGLSKKQAESTAKEIKKP